MGRDAVPRDHSRVARVSIHAPAWGATSGGAGSGGTEKGFNPRARMGRDLVDSVTV